jgi:hypothetical protein
MPHQAPLQPGDPRRVGRYRLGGRIVGIPAEGPIYLGTGPDGTEVSISVLHSEWTRDAAARDRFAAEAAVAKRVPPFCAARILDAGLDGADAFLISEYVPGRSLLEIISAEGVLAGPDLEAVAIGMATGLASVHLAGLVHGNFGPEYVIMTAAGPRVVEFGITPPYGAATPSADMAAWAQTVVFAASGKPPATVADLDVLSGILRGVVVDCLNADPAERPAARAAIVALIGNADPPAGVLAEGSRRAVPGTTWTGTLEREVAARSWPELSRPGLAHAQTARRAAGAPASAPPGRMAMDRGTEPRPAVTRHGRDTGPRPATYPPPLPPDRHGGQHQQAGRGRRLVPIAVAAVVVCVAVIFLVVQALSGGNPPQAGGKPSGGTSSSPVPTSTPSPTPTAVTPAKFAGRWSGRVTQPLGSYNVSIRLTSGSGTGTITYSGSNLNCSGVLSVISNSSTHLTLSQRVTTGPCLPGTVHLARISDDSVRFTFDGSGPQANGTLTKS